MTKTKPLPETNVNNDDNHQTRAASKQKELNTGIKFDLDKLHDAMQHVTPEIRCGFATINYLDLYKTLSITVIQDTTNLVFCIQYTRNRAGDMVRSW